MADAGAVNVYVISSLTGALVIIVIIYLIYVYRGRQVETLTR